MFTNYFCQQVLCANDITRYIGENFIVWAWDRTNDINYARYFYYVINHRHFDSIDFIFRLLEILEQNFTAQIKDKIASLPTAQFPVLICLRYHNGRVDITKTIQGHVSHDLVFDMLKQARYEFDTRIETPHSTGPLLPPIVLDDWSVSPSVLKSIERTSEEFEKIANAYAGQAEHVVQIDKIENSSWSKQYLVQKEDSRGDNQIEEMLVFPCSQARAQHILERGFKSDDTGIYQLVPSS